MIIVRVLKAGLGNQLFEYSYGRYLAKKFDQQLYMYFPNKMDHNSTYRNGLGLLGIQNDHKINWIQMTILSRGKNILHALFMLKAIIFYRNKSINLMLEKYEGERLAKRGILLNYTGAACKDYFEKKRKISYIRGYFQFPKYVYDNKEELMSLLKFSENEESVYKKIIDIMDSSVSVCIHVRRGDFLKCERHHVYDDNYYIEAIQKIKTLFSRAVFFVFSDDCDYVKDRMFWFNNSEVYFVQDMMKNKIEDIDELRLMGYCKHFIISNSTFSWWGQFAGVDKNKVVIAPDRWYGTDEKTMLYDEKWILIKTRETGRSKGKTKNVSQIGSCDTTGAK